MTIDIKAVYLTVTVVGVMILLAVITVKKLMSTRSKFSTFLMVIEELIGAVTLGYVLSLAYMAMEDYTAFVQKYGELKDYFTYISIYFCASQIIILVLVSIYRFIKKRTKFIKNRRIIR